MNALLLSFLLLACTARWTAAADTTSILTNLQNRYAEDRAVALRLVLARYADELEMLQKNLLEAGDATGAARVQLERDRVMPALGLPAVSAENAEDFAAFEEPVPASTLPAVMPASTPTDLDGILKTLLPAAPPSLPAQTAASTPPSTPPAGPPGRGGRRVLRMSTAELQGTYDPLYGYVYWLGGRSASWTLSDLPSGSYKLLLRYASDAQTGGGRVRAKFGDTTSEADVPSTGGWKRKRDLMLGPFEITNSRAEITLTPASIRPGGSYLMDLSAVLVLPADASTTP